MEIVEYENRRLSWRVTKSVTECTKELCLCLIAIKSKGLKGKIYPLNIPRFRIMRRNDDMEDVFFGIIAKNESVGVSVIGEGKLEHYILCYKEGGMFIERQGRQGRQA